MRVDGQQASDPPQQVEDWNEDTDPDGNAANRIDKDSTDAYAARPGDFVDHKAA
jgi:hypothetical protein